MVVFIFCTLTCGVCSPVMGGGAPATAMIFWGPTV